MAIDTDELRGMHEEITMSPLRARELYRKSAGYPEYQTVKRISKRESEQVLAVMRSEDHCPSFNYALTIIGASDLQGRQKLTWLWPHSRF